MPFLDHLEELRSRIIFCLVSVVVLSAGSYAFSGILLDFLTRPVGNLYFFNITEAFMARVKVSIACGLVLSFPVILFQLWRFISPALKKEEKRYTYPAILSSTLLFVGGVWFAYSLILPVGVKFLLAFGTESLRGLLGVSRYLSFLLFFVLSFGLVFQLPVVIFFLARLGIVSPETLRKRRREAIVIIFIAAAVLTPSVDMFTQLMMGLPLLVLYEISIWVAKLATRRQAAEN
jgi:sec-independent protein translocase protein TatC